MAEITGVLTGNCSPANGATFDSGTEVTVKVEGEFTTEPTGGAAKTFKCTATIELLSYKSCEVPQLESGSGSLTQSSKAESVTEGFTLPKLNNGSTKEAPITVDDGYYSANYMLFAQVKNQDNTYGPAVSLAAENRTFKIGSAAGLAVPIATFCTGKATPTPFDQCTAPSPTPGQQIPRINTTNFSVLATPAVKLIGDNNSPYYFDFLYYMEIYNPSGTKVASRQDFSAKVGPGAKAIVKTDFSVALTGAEKKLDLGAWTVRGWVKAARYKANRFPATWSLLPPFFGSQPSESGSDAGCKVMYQIYQGAYGFDVISSASP
jgi:hypothetical protein